MERLSKPFDAFPKPSSQTKTTFEQKTSAINVTPSTNSRFDIKEIKEDSLWLSQATNIDEVSALRTVVGECQARTGTQLLGSFSEEELVSLRDASGNSKYSSAIPLSSLPQGLDSKEIKAAFESQASRRQRILVTYLSEKRHLLKCVEVLLSKSRVYNAKALGGREGKDKERASWLETAGNILLQRLDTSDDLLLSAFKSIEANASNLGTGSGCFSEDGGREEIELEWARSQIIEATHAMEIVFEIIDRSDTVTSSRVILEWLRLLQTCGFFDSLENVGTLVYEALTFTNEVVIG